MSIETELQAIQTGAAIAILADRAFLRITGSDATRWLNGMVTNSIQSLAPGEGNYNFLLNAQGRIQADCTIYREPTEGDAVFLLETDKPQIEAITTLLDKFIIMDDVELQPVPSNEESLLLIGPNTPDIVNRYFRASHADLRPLRIAFDPELPRQITTPFSGSVPTFELRTSDTASSQAYFLEAGAVLVSPEALEAHRILNGTPKFGTDIRDKDLPQETNQTHALHFNKGCYLGQEIVERIRSRGQVHRTFTKFTLEGDLPTEFPTPLEANAKPAGEITSAIRIGSQIHALGYIRREALELKQQVTYAGGTAVPS